MFYNYLIYRVPVINEKLPFLYSQMVGGGNLTGALSVCIFWLYATLRSSGVTNSVIKSKSHLIISELIQPNIEPCSII